MEVWIVLLFLVVFPVFWAGSCLLTAQMGWARLARAYRTDTEATGDAHHGVSGRIGLMSYNGILTVGIEPEGLRLAVMVLFRAGHPPLRIPWSDVANVRKSAALWGTYYAFEATRAASVTIRLPERIAQSIIDMAA